MADGRITPTSVALILASHTLWGCFPVLGRYLQDEDQPWGGLPSLALTAAAHLVALVVHLPTAVGCVARKHFRRRAMLLYMFFVVIRAVTNVLSVRYAPAIYVQLIGLSTPLIVALLNRFFAQTPLSRYLPVALLFLLLGSALVITGGFEDEVFDNVTPEAALGMGLALASSACLALSMHMVRLMAKNQTPPDAVLFAQLLAVVVVSAPMSLAFQEDFAPWASLNAEGIAVFVAFGLLVFYAANKVQIRAIQLMGAPTVSSVVAFRLVIAVALSYVLLDEPVTTVFEWMGIAVVCATITLYLGAVRFEQRGILCSPTLMMTLCLCRPLPRELRRRVEAPADSDDDASVISDVDESDPFLPGANVRAYETIQ